MLLEVLKGICILLTGFLSGGTLYSSFIEIPVRQKLNEAAQIQNWKLVFDKAHRLLKVSGLSTCALTLTTWYLTSNVLWLVSFFTLVLILPYTKFLLTQTNDILLKSKSGSGLADHIRKWDRLHHGRTAICLLGFLLCIAAALG